MWKLAGLNQEMIYLKKGKTQFQRDEKSSVKPKYRDHISGETWSGRGKEPSWLIKQDISKFRVF